MGEEPNVAPAFDLRSILSGAVWGLGMLVLAGLMQGILSHLTPLAPATETLMAMLWQGGAALLAGFLSARRAAAAGWLHGGIAGLMVVLGISLVMGVVAALPTLAALLKMGAAAVGVGALGGMAGAATRR